MNTTFKAPPTRAIVLSAISSLALVACSGETSVQILQRTTPAVVLPQLEAPFHGTIVQTALRVRLRYGIWYARHQDRSS